MHVHYSKKGIWNYKFRRTWLGFTTIGNNVYFKSFRFLGFEGYLYLNAIFVGTDPSYSKTYLLKIKILYLNPLNTKWTALNLLIFLYILLELWQFMITPPIYIPILLRENMATSTRCILHFSSESLCIVWDTA